MSWLRRCDQNWMARKVVGSKPTKVWLIILIFLECYNDCAHILKNKHVCKNTTLNEGKFLPTFYVVIFNKFFYECK